MPTVFQVADKIFKEPETEYLNAAGVAIIRVWREFNEEDPLKIKETSGNGKETFQVFNYPEEFQEVIKYLLIGKKGRAKVKEAVKNYRKYLETGVLEIIEQPKRKNSKKFAKKQVLANTPPKRKKRKRIQNS